LNVGAVSNNLKTDTDMRTISTIAILGALIVLLAECDTIASFIISKSVSVLILAVFGRLFVKTMTEEELNEEV
jgi:hypothetical protein